MRKHFFRILSIFLALSLVSTLAFHSFALEWDGDSVEGGGGGSSAGKVGFAIRTTGDNVIGYRFSLVDAKGNNKAPYAIDVFRNTSAGNNGYSTLHRCVPKYNKGQLIKKQDGTFSTALNLTNCYKEADMGFATALPTPDDMVTWQNYTTNLNKVLSKLGAGSIDKLKVGDKIIVEPIYDVRLESVWHAVTVTEIAVYGKHLFGFDTKITSSNDPETFGFIANYTNKHYPNELFTPDGQELWAGATATSQRLTFGTMISSGYGVGIAYTQQTGTVEPEIPAPYPLSLSPITPNAAYREGTTVISSFWLINSGHADVTPARNIAILLRVYHPNGTLITKQTATQVIVPKCNYNLYYFKWTVPTGLNGASVCIVAEIVDAGKTYGTCTRSYATRFYPVFDTPDTDYEAQAPNDFSVPALPSATSSYASWWQWEWADGTFSKKSYGIGIPSRFAEELTPDERSNSTNSDGTWIMKSGYGVWLKASNRLCYVSGYEAPAMDAYTPIQFAYAAYPEFGYKYGVDLCTTLRLRADYWYFSYPANPQYHYTPIYYPDGAYIVKIVKSDMWTPAGMIGANATTKPITIKDSAYDDWFVGRE